MLKEKRFSCHQPLIGAIIHNRKENVVLYFFLSQNSKTIFSYHLSVQKSCAVQDIEIKKSKSLSVYNNLGIQAKFGHCKRQNFVIFQERSRILRGVLTVIIRVVKKDGQEKMGLGYK